MRPIFEEGTCTFCKRATSYYCDHCNKWVCESHLKKIHVAHDKDIHLCKDCLKNLKPGVIIAGVAITPEMMPDQ